MNRSTGSRSIARAIGLLPFLVVLAVATGTAAGPTGNPAAGPASGPSSGPAAGDPYLHGLLEAAARLELHRDPYWRTLLHYKRGLLGGRSLVDDPDFFLAPDGKRNPEAELEATLRAFFHPPVEEGKHPVCRFPARLAWLREKLGIDPDRLPVPSCESFDRFIEAIRPESATLIFPTAHMNSPASMYGHTLLTIEAESGSKLLAYAVNYSALSTDTFGPLYIVKGVFGAYEGYFSILPYYAKLQEYSDVNDRDIWEYPLNLTREEVRRLLMHLFELEEIHSDYFFFKENCSYDLLLLIEAARPSVRLTDDFRWWVIPLDTIRSVREAGLAGEPVYRPSKSTKVRHLAARLPGPAREEALAVAGGTLDPAEYAGRDIPPAERIEVLDLAVEYLQYGYAKHEIAREDYLKRFLPALKARSALGGAEEEIAIPAPPRPDLGHRSNRFGFAAGAGRGRLFQELRLRPAYHDLLDDDRGFLRGSQIVFFEPVARYYPRAERLEVESLTFIDIASVSPRDAFFKPTSWKFRTGFFRRMREDRGRDLVFDVNTGFGRAYAGRVLGLGYLLLEADVQAGGALRRNHSVGVGLSGGLIRGLAPGWKLQLHARNILYGLGEDGNIMTVGLGQNIRLDPDVGLRIDAGFERRNGASRFESSLGWNIFF